MLFQSHLQRGKKPVESLLKCFQYTSFICRVKTFITKKERELNKNANAHIVLETEFLKYT